MKSQSRKFLRPVMRESLISWCLFPGTIILLLFTLLPFAWMLCISFFTRPDFFNGADSHFTFSNYWDVLSSDSLHFLDFVKNSLIISGLSALLSSLIAALAAYAVSRLHFRGRIVIPLAILAMSMFPQISIVGYLYQSFSSLGWINTYAALVLPYIALTVPLALWITLSYFMQIPLDLDKAALVDGAGRLKTLFKIILPIAAPGIFSGFLLVFIQCFNEFLFAILLTIDYHAQTLPVGIALFEGTHGEIPWGNLMAASTMASIPLILLALLFQRFIVSGLAGGAVKG